MKSVKKAIKTIRIVKFLIEILSICLIILAIIYSAAYIFIAFKGKDFVIKKIEGLTQKKVTIGYFEVTPLMNIEMRNLNIEGVAKVDSILISPSITNLLIGNLVMNKVRIMGPEITYERNISGTIELPALTSFSKIAAIPVKPAGSKSKKPLRITFRKLKIRGGKVNFIDRKAGPEGIKITAKDIEFNLTNVYSFPFTVITNFDLDGSIPWSQGKEAGKFEAEGWINFFKKDMQTKIKIKDIDGIYFYPYYAKWVDLEKAGIERANLNFTSNIQGLDNNLTAECHLELTDIVRRPRSPEEPAERAEKIADVVLDMFRGLNQGKIVLDFTIRTKMDRPQFILGNIKQAVENKITQARGSGVRVEGIFMLPGKILEGFVKGAADFSKAVIDGTFAVGNEVKKSVEDSFKKPPPPPTNTTPAE